MKGRLPKKGSEYYLPEETYRMVQHFCYSYKEMRREALAITGLKSPNMDGMPHAPGVSNPTERDALRLAELDRKCKIIEDACNGNPWIWKAVTDKRMSYRELRDKYGCPYGHNQFGRLKQLVYWRVSKQI